MRAYRGCCWHFTRKTPANDSRPHDIYFQLSLTLLFIGSNSPSLLGVHVPLWGFRLFLSPRWPFESPSFVTGWMELRLPRNHHQLFIDIGTLLYRDCYAIPRLRYLRNIRQTLVVLLEFTAYSLGYNWHCLYSDFVIASAYIRDHLICLLYTLLELYWRTCWALSDIALKL